MFDSLVREAKSTVDNALSSLVYRAIFGVLLLVALGFGTASLSLWVNKQFGPETGNLIVAGLFVFAALIAYLVAPGPTSSGSAPEPAAGTEAASETGEAPQDLMSALDKDLIYSAATAALPVALPKIMRVLVRNLPLLAALASAIYILTRPIRGDYASETTAADAGDSSAAPAE